MIGHVLALGEHLPELGAGQHEPVFLAVGAGPHGGHAVALEAVERMVDLERLGLERALRDIVEDLLRVKGAVVVAHAGMVTADDQVAAAEVLAEERVQERFTRSGIPHFHGIAALDGGILHKVLIHQGVDGVSAHIGRDVSLFELAQDLVDQYAIHGLDGDLGEVLVGAVHGVPGLERGDRAPPLVLEHLAGLLRRHVDALEGLREVGLGKDLYGTGQVHIGLAHDLLNARVPCNVHGAEDLLALMLLVGLGHGILLGHLHGGHDRARLFVHEGDLLALLERVGELGARRERHRNRPERAVRHLVLVAHALPVLLGHEARERGEGPDAHHHEVRGLARGDLELL